MEIAHRIIIACRIMQPELEKVVKPGDDVEIRYLDQGLHMTPRKMGPAIQEQIDRVSGRCCEIVLGYGLCANGVVGVKARDQGLYIPKSHDCIALFMGSCEDYRIAIKTRPGTFYLTAGWIEDRKDPLSYLEDYYVPKMGRKMAEWGMKEELKHYSHFALINTGAGNSQLLRSQALENAAYFGMEFDEISGSLVYFRKMIFKSLDDSDFLFIKPGEAVRQNLFLDFGRKVASEETNLRPAVPPEQSPPAAVTDPAEVPVEDLIREVKATQ